MMLGINPIIMKTDVASTQNRPEDSSDNTSTMPVPYRERKEPSDELATQLWRRRDIQLLHVLVRSWVSVSNTAITKEYALWLIPKVRQQAAVTVTPLHKNNRPPVQMGEWIEAMSTKSGI